jgi:hypothetical protein
MPISFDACLWISIALIALLFLFNDWHSKHRSDLAQIRFSDLISPKLLSSMAILIADLLFAGPQLVTSAMCSFGTAIRLSRLNHAQGALLLGLLLAHSGRVKYGEAAVAVGSANFVNLLAALRYVDGIVFLTSEPQGLSLTEELRSELCRVAGYRSHVATEPKPIFIPCSACGFGIEVVQPVQGSWFECGGCGRLNQLIMDNGRWTFLNRFHEQTATRPRADETPLRYYAILGLKPGGSVEEIKRAYRRMMKINHPDLVAGLGRDLEELAEARSKEINEAYAFLVRGK